MPPFRVGASLALTAALAGCSTNSESPAPRAAVAAVDGSQYLLAAEPQGARPVIDVRKEAQHQDEVVVVGRIGGTKDPWVEGRAAFTVVDQSLRACNDIPGDNCPYPWDYCCEADLPSARLLVKFVDADGRLIAADARELLKLRELQTVVVRGRAQRDDAGNVALLASGLYVRPEGGGSNAGTNAHDHAHED